MKKKINLFVYKYFWQNKTHLDQMWWKKKRQQKIHQNQLPTDAWCGVVFKLCSTGSSGSGKQHQMLVFVLLVYCGCSQLAVVKKKKKYCDIKAAFLLYWNCCGWRRKSWNRRNMIIYNYIYNSAHLIHVALHTQISSVKRAIHHFRWNVFMQFIAFQFKILYSDFGFVFGFWRSCLAFIWFICLWFLGGYTHNTTLHSHYTCIHILVSSYGRFCFFTFFIALFRFLAEHSHNKCLFGDVWLEMLLLLLLLVFVFNIISVSVSDHDYIVIVYCLLFNILFILYYDHQ